MPSFLVTVDTPLAERDYVVSVTRLQIRSPRTALSFFRRLGPVQRQMRNSPGLVSFGLRAQLLKMTFSTYGVFEDRKAMVAFVSSAAHGDAMQSLRGGFHQVESRTVVTTGAEIPADWATINGLLTATSEPLKSNVL